MDTGRISEGAGGSPEFVSSGSDKGGIRISFTRESYSVSGGSKPPLTHPGERFFPSFFQRLRGSPIVAAAAPKTSVEISSSEPTSGSEKAIQKARSEHPPSANATLWMISL